MPNDMNIKPYQVKGTDAAWYKGWNLTAEERERFRHNTVASQAAKGRAMRENAVNKSFQFPPPIYMRKD